MSIPHNFKYHTVEELDRLCDQLKLEIEHLKKTVGSIDATSVQMKTLEDSEQMLQAAEYEILERTLLNCEPS